MEYYAGDFSRIFETTATRKSLTSTPYCKICLSLIFLQACSSFYFLSAVNPTSIFECDKWFSCAFTSSLTNFTSESAPFSISLFKNRFINALSIMCISSVRNGSMGLSVWYSCRNGCRCWAIELKLCNCKGNIGSHAHVACFTELYDLHVGCFDCGFFDISSTNLHRLGQISRARLATGTFSSHLFKKNY